MTKNLVLKKTKISIIIEFLSRLYYQSFFCSKLSFKSTLITFSFFFLGRKTKNGKKIRTRLNTILSKAQWQIFLYRFQFQNKWSIFFNRKSVCLWQNFFPLVYRKEVMYRISSYSCCGNYSFLNSSSEETIQVFISLM